MPRPSAVRSLPARVWGSNTRIRDEVPILAGLYHGGRGVRWALRNWRRTAAGVLILWLWVTTGSLAWSLLLVGVSAGVGLTGWVAWRRRGAEGAAGVTLRGALRAYRQRQALHRQWHLACRTAGLIGPGQDTGPALRKVRATSGTITATVRSGVVGVPVPSIMKASVTLAEVIGCREVVVVQTGPGVADLAFHWADPIGRDLPLSQLPIARPGDLAYGIRQDGTVATVRATQSVLIGGLTRMGKSNTVWALLADALRQGIPVDLYVSDPKGGVELDALEAHVGQGRVGLLRVREYAKTPAETVKMIDAAEKSMHARQYWMKQNGVRKITTPDETNPLVVVILDETLPLTDLLKKGTDSALGRIGYTGAAAAHVVWANTQVAQVDALGRFRDLIPQRICFATPNPQVTDSVLGQGTEASGAKCSDIRTPGVGYSHTEGDVVARKFRAAKVTDAETRAIAAGRLPAKVMNAARELYDRRAEDDAARASGKRGDRRTALYRWFYVGNREYGDSLGYVGISYDVIQREAQHNHALREFLEGDVRRTTDWYPTRAEAEAAEREAIATERPIWNVAHNGSNPKRRRLTVGAR